MANIPVINTQFTYETLEEKLYITPKGQSLYIGLPKEQAFQEHRIGLTPEAVHLLVANGHKVVIEHNAGEGCHYSDNDYSEAGAIIEYNTAEVYKADILVKTAPVVTQDLALLQYNQTIISPVHYVAMQADIIKGMMDKKITAISFENLKDESNGYPIVNSMSEIAGSAVMLIAGQYLSNFNNGKGVLLGGISGVPPTKVVIIGAGIVGQYAAKNALALGASVKVFDNNISKLAQLQQFVGQKVWTSIIEPKILAKQLKTCEVAVGALSNEHGNAPLIVTEEMVSNMRSGSVIIDVVIDRGGCFETSQLTNHHQPTVIKHQVVHYGVPNIPSVFARTASQAISNVLNTTLLQIGKNGGVHHTIKQHQHLHEGVYIYKGCLTSEYFSQKFSLHYNNIQLLFTSRR